MPLARLRATTGDGEDVLPILWSDNYITLMGGETSTVTAHYTAGPQGNAVTVKVQPVRRQCLMEPIPQITLFTRVCTNPLCKV